MYVSHISNGGSAMSGGGGSVFQSAPNTEMHASVKLVGAALVTQLCSLQRKPVCSVLTC